MSDFLLRYPFPEDEVTAFSTLRNGGVSTGVYESLNVSPTSGDQPDNILENRRRLADALGISPDRFVIPHQNHGTEVRFVSEPVELEGVDALVTRQTGLCICVSTADCIPILLHDPAHHAVAAVHSGWRGTSSRIVQIVLRAMQEQLGTRPADVQAAIGPGIGLEAFEVGDEVYEAFRQARFPMEQVARRMEKWHIDLWQANRLLLQEAGVERIHLAAICTYSQHDRFFSARRLGRKCGRIMNGIILRR